MDFLKMFKAAMGEEPDDEPNDRAKGASFKPTSESVEISKEQIKKLTTEQKLMIAGLPEMKDALHFVALVALIHDEVEWFEGDGVRVGKLSHPDTGNIYILSMGGRRNGSFSVIPEPLAQVMADIRGLEYPNLPKVVKAALESKV